MMIRMSCETFRMIDGVAAEDGAEDGDFEGDLFIVKC